MHGDMDPDTGLYTCDLCGTDTGMDWCSDCDSCIDIGGCCDCEDDDREPMTEAELSDDQHGRRIGIF